MYCPQLMLAKNKPQTLASLRTGEHFLFLKQIICIHELITTCLSKAANKQRIQSYNNKSHPIHNDLVTFERKVCTYICLNNKNGMERLKKKSKLVFALEIVLYFMIAISLALVIIL